LDGVILAWLQLGLDQLVITALLAVSVWFTPEIAGKRLPGSGPSVATKQEARVIVEAGLRESPL
jgi:hypothetical protein